MKLDLTLIQEADANLRKAAEKEPLSEEFRQSLYAYMDMVNEFFASIQEFLVRATSKNSHLPPSNPDPRGF